MKLGTHVKDWDHLFPDHFLNIFYVFMQRFIWFSITPFGDDGISAF